MKLFTQSFKNLFFAALALAAGRVVAFPIEITKLTKGKGKDQITIFNIKDIHVPKKNDATNATALIEFAQKKNAMVFVENPKNELKKILHNAQTKLALNKEELDIINRFMEERLNNLDTIFLGQFKQSQTNGIETFDPRSALAIPMILLAAAYNDNKITEEQGLKALGLYAAALYDLYTTIKQSNDTITDPAIKNYCTKLLEDLKDITTLNGQSLAACDKTIQPENTQEIVALGKKIASKNCILLDQLIFNHLFFEYSNNIITLPDITILQKFDRAITAGTKNFVFCTGACHANRLEKLFTDNNYKKDILYKPDYLTISNKEQLSMDEIRRLNIALESDSDFITIARHIKVRDESPAPGLALSIPEIELSSILKNESSSTPTENKAVIPSAQNTHQPIFTPQNLLLAGGTLTLIAATKAYGPRLWNWIKSKF